MSIILKRIFGLIVFFTGTVFFSQGCTKHNVRLCPENIPDEQVAKVVCPRPISIVQIDGESAAKNPFVTVKSVILAPGKHTIKTHWYLSMGRTSYSSFSSEMWFVAEPGKTYIANYQELVPLSRINFWVEDESTGKTVGGIKGSIDEPPS
jgi:hypothetical protein